MDGILFLLFYEHRKWTIKIVKDTYDIEEVGWLKAPKNLTPYQMIQKINPLFDPEKQERIKDWYSFFQTLAQQAHPNFVYATYNQYTSIPKFGGFFDVFEYQNGYYINVQSYRVDIPKKEYQKLCKILETTAQIDEDNMISTRETITVKAFQTAHQAIENAMIAEQFGHTGIVVSLVPNT